MIPNRFIPLFFCIGIFAACNTHKPAAISSNSLERKSEPYDHFTFQRCYPDTVFNWEAWRRMIRTASEAAVADRSASCTGGTVSTTPWTLQGPANHAGRVNSIAVKPNDENTVLVGFGGGGIFKTTDAGNNWTPVFDEFAQLSIGTVNFDPSNPNTVYAGTGDVNMPSILYNGDGVYKSTDAGDTWQYLGLNQAGVISEIIVHPTNPQVMWVASMGNPYVRTTERGVYKTTDGGQTWQKVLFVSNNSGCSSLVMSASNPQILYASFWNRLRNSTESFVAGPHAKVFKSTDGGDTWTELGGGLPTWKNGRTGLAVSQQDPNKVYALYIDTLSTTGSLHLTTDGGTSWTTLNTASLEDACADFGWYFGKLSLHPTNDNDLYFHGILLHRRLTNGSWLVASGGHADSHDLAFCPSGRRYWANDGGIYRNEPGQQIWIKSKNLPATQSYRTAWTPLRPNDYWTGTQDNGVKRGNSATLNNWADVIASDGFSCAFHPTSTDTFWVETQNGTVWGTNNNGANWSSGGSAFGTMDRVGWDAPFIRSIHPPYTFYAGTYRLLTSPNGYGFGAGSGDLTDGVIIAPRFHVLSSISESPLLAGKLFVGTTDANVWWRSPAGIWTNISAGLPNRYVTSVVPSPTLTNRLFVTHSGFRDNENIPHLHRSDDNGQSWVNISGDMPQVPVNQIFVVPNAADSILVAATDAGVFATKNSGANWYRLGEGMPSVPVFDFKHDFTNKRLVAATHGRGVWTFPMDSIRRVQTTTPVAVSAAGMVRNVLGQGISKTSFPDVLPGVLSDTTGAIQLNGLPGCTTTVFKPYRNDDPTNGLTAYDLVLISRHILNLEPIDTPYKLIAADANKSKTVTNFDIVQLRKILLGTDTAFQNNTSWRFIPASYQFSGQPNPLLDTFPEQVTVNLEQTDAVVPAFIGVKIGDLDQNALPHFGPGTAEERQWPQWPIWLSEPVATNNAVEMPLLTNFKGLSGIQFTLEFDPAQWEWLEPGTAFSDMAPELHFNTQNAANGQVTFVYEPSAEVSTEHGWLFTTRFKRKNNRSETPELRLTGARTRAWAFDEKGNPFVPVLLDPPNGRDLLRLFPNPAYAENSWLQTAENGRVWIADMHGKVWLNTSVTAGQPLRITGLKNGVYTVSFKGKKTATARLVVLD